MSTPTERIVKLIPQLPAKDIPIAERFVEARDFCSLKELVDSAIYKVKKSQKSLEPKEEYKNIDLEELSRLKSEVDSYLVILGDDEEPNEDDETDFNQELEDIY
jgi:hypothetical protein